MAETTNKSEGPEMSDLVARLRAEAKALRQFASEDDDYPADIAAILGEAASRLEALEKAAAPFVLEAKNWPDYVPDSDGLFIASPDDILPILEENASQYGRASCGISYSDDVVTVGDLRALARAAGEGETK